MKRPDPNAQKNQEAFLKNCPETDRAYHARMFRIGNAVFRYHQLADCCDDETLQVYYKEWLEGLPANIRETMKRHGFDKCRSILSFTRYVNERNDTGMEQWLKLRLSVEDFEYWQQNSPPKNT